MTPVTTMSFGANFVPMGPAFGAVIPEKLDAIPIPDTVETTTAILEFFDGVPNDVFTAMAHDALDQQDPAVGHNPIGAKALEENQILYGGGVRQMTVVKFDTPVVGPVFRALANPEDPDDHAAAQALQGYFRENDLNANGLNDLSAKPNGDGSFTNRFGGCGEGVGNCPPIMGGWKSAVRMYEPERRIVDGRWTFPGPPVARSQ